MLGTILSGRYTITARVGKGAMGTVYRATDAQTGQEVAVKVLSRDLALEQAMVERFRREGEALRQLRHPNIVGFVDMFAHEEQQVIVMEYVPGGNLHQLLRQGPLPVEQARRIALELCDALTRAHHLNIIHRDLKPENVLLAADGTPKLTDFGVARLVSEGTRLTGTGTQVGTPYYMAPEAWEGTPLDAQADIWALGVVLFEMLTGQVPFSGDTLIAVMNKVLNAPLPDLRQLRPEVPPGLAQVVAGMLTRDKAQRYTSMRLVAADLERGEPTSSAGPALTRPAAKARPGLGLPAWAWVTGGAVLAIAGLSAILIGAGPRLFPAQASTHTAEAQPATATPRATGPTPSAQATPSATPAARTRTPANATSAPPTLSPIQKGLTVNFCGNQELCVADYVGTMTPLGLEGQFGSIDRYGLSWAPDGKSVAFSACLPEEMNHPQACQSLYTTDRDGKNIKKVLSHTLAPVKAASWSPDGKWIAVSDDGQLAIVRPDGTGRQVLSSTPKVIRAAWSPDSQRLAWIGSQMESGALQIWVMEVDGGQPRLIYQDSSQAITREQVIVAWSPDAKSVAYADESGQEYLVRADCVAGPQGCEAGARTPLDRLPSHWLADFYPQWAGEKKATRPARLELCDGDVCVVDTKGRRTPLKLSDKYQDFTGLSWAPDGQRFVFAACPHGATLPCWTPFIASADGQTVTLLFSQPADNTYQVPAWSPDGQYIAYHHMGKLEVLRFDGQGWTLDKTYEGDCPFNLAWSPDSQRIAWTAGACGTGTANQPERVVVTDRASGQTATLFRPGDVPLSSDNVQQSLAWNPGGNIVAITLENGEVYFANAGGCMGLAEGCTPSSPGVNRAREIPAEWLSSYSPPWGGLETPADEARAFAEPILAAIANRPPDFADDFSAAAASRQKWDLSQAVVQTGTLWVQMVANSPHVQAKDFALQFDLRAHGNGAASFTTQFRFFYGNDNQEAFYALNLAPAEKHWSAWGVKGDLSQQQELDSGQSDHLGLEQWMHLLLVARGDRFAIYLNNLPLTYFQDAANESPVITLVGNKRAMNIEIDNVKFWDLAKVPDLP